MLSNEVAVLRQKRTEIVEKYIAMKKPLQDKRRKGEMLNEIEWDIWDKINTAREREIMPIDFRLIELGEEV